MGLINPVTMSIAKVILCIFSFLLTAGPPMLCIGIALMIIPTDRMDLVDRFNQATRIYIDSGAANYAKALTNSSSAAISGAPATVATVGTYIMGDTDKVDDFPASTVVAASAPLSSAFDISLDEMTPFTISGIPLVQTQYAMVSCGNRTAAGCSAAAMTATCKASYGPDSIFIGTDASVTANGCSFGHCGECTIVAYLKAACFVVQPAANGTFVRDPALASCNYPFTVTTQTYEAAAAAFPTVAVTVRANTDPYIALQSITKGTSSFGPNKMDERMSGYGLLVAGAIMTLLFIFIIVQLKFKYDEILEEEAEEAEKEAAFDAERARCDEMREAERAKADEKEKAEEEAAGKKE